MPLFDKLKSKIEGYANKAQQQLQDEQHRGRPANKPPPPPPQQNGTRLAWPPKLVRAPDVLGEIRDVNGRNIPRDIGRSISLGGKLYYIFGDTFCYDDKCDFKGCSDNTVAFIPDPKNPTASQYLSRDVKVPNFIPLTPNEDKFTRENREANKRVVNWCFGGIAEDSKGGEGWLFYDKLESRGGLDNTGFGMGVARVRLGDGNQIHCDRIMGEEMLFKAHEPRFGSITTWKDSDGFVYLLGGSAAHNDWENYLARIPHAADFTQRASYQFFGKNAQWLDSYASTQDLQGILGGQNQGGIVEMREHAPEGKPYVWFGVDRFMTSKFYVGVAERVQGPWNVKEVGELPKVMESSNHRYCLYPHLWASKPEKGGVMLSWSDDGQLGGKVAAANFYFELV